MEQAVSYPGLMERNSKIKMNVKYCTILMDHCCSIAVLHFLTA